MNSTQMAWRIENYVRDSERTKSLFSFDRREQKRNNNNVQIWRNAIYLFKYDAM